MAQTRANCQYCGRGALGAGNPLGRTTDGDRLAARVMRLLKPSGRIVLAFAAPTGSRNGDLFTGKATAALTGSGFPVSETRHDEDGQSVAVLHAVSP